MIGPGPLHGVLDANGEGESAAGRSEASGRFLTARAVPSDRLPRLLDAAGPIKAAGEPADHDDPDRCRSRKAGALRPVSLKETSLPDDGTKVDPLVRARDTVPCFRDRVPDAYPGSPARHSGDPPRSG